MNTTRMPAAGAARHSADPRSADRRAAARRGAGLLAAGIGLVLLAGCGGPAPAANAGSAPAASASSGPNPNAVNAAGDIPDNQVFVPFTPRGGGFTVSVPQGWAQSSQGGATVFTDHYNSVRIESSAVPTAPTVASATAGEVPKLKAATPGFVLGKVETVQRSAGQAVLITYEATSAPNPVTGKTVAEAVERYTFWKGGREVVLTLSAPKGSDNVDPWRKVTDSFRWQ